MVTKVKLVYEATGIAVSTKDAIHTAHLGIVHISNLHAPRKATGPGRVTLTLSDGRKGDYNPSVIGAKWIIG
jgi:hypothetical protein